MTWTSHLLDAAHVGAFAARNRWWWRATIGGARRLGRSFLAGRRDLYMALSAHAAAAPDDLAVSDAEQTWTYADLLHASEQVARSLCRMRTRPGERVAVVLKNRCAHVACMSGIRMAGCVPVPLSPQLPAARLKDRLRSVDAAAAFVESSHAASAAQALRHPAYRVVSMAPSDDARHVTLWQALQDAPGKGVAERRPPRRAPDLVLHTSGTTSGASTSTHIHMARSGVATALRYADAFDLSEGCTLFTPCPLYHAAPMLLTGLVWTLGGHVVLRDRLDDEAWDAFSWSGATHAFLVPTLLEGVSGRDDEDLLRLRAGPLRALISSGAPLRPALKQRLLQQLGPVLYDMYGATELGVVAVANPRDLALRPHAVGRPLPGVEVRIVGPKGEAVDHGAPGELFVRSASVTVGGAPPRHPSLTGWESAGDIAQLEDGWLTIVDRARDVVISGGVNVFPADVEKVLERHPAIRRAACFGRPHAKWGEAVCAAIEVNTGQAPPDTEDLLALCREHLPPAAVPKAITTVQRLPVSATGKVLRRELRANLRDG